MQVRKECFKKSTSSVSDLSQELYGELKQLKIKDEISIILLFHTATEAIYSRVHNSGEQLLEVTPLFAMSP